MIKFYCKVNYDMIFDIIFNIIFEHFFNSNFKRYIFFIWKQEAERNMESNYWSESRNLKANKLCISAFASGKIRNHFQSDLQSWIAHWSV